MSDGFKKFKQKIVFEVLIKCISVSVSFSLISIFLPILLFKLNKLEYNLFVLIGLGLGIGLITMGLMLLFLYPRNKKVAKRLDKQLVLNEKVQTMLEYIDQDEPMIKLQREQTSNILKSLSLKSFTMKFSVFFIAFISLIGLFALTVTVSALAISGVEENVEIDDDQNNQNQQDQEPDYELDDWTTLAILNIIEYVEAADFDNSLKTKYISLLNGLIEDLKKDIKDSEVDTLVKNVITNVQYELDKINSNKEIYEVLRNSNVSTISALGSQINRLDEEQVKNALDGLIIFIGGNSQAVVELDAEFGELLKKSVLSTALANDDLFKAIIQFADKIRDTRNTSDVDYAVQNVIDMYADDILNAVNYQAKNKDVAIYIETKLIEIFELTSGDDVDNDIDIDDGTNNDTTDPEDPDKLPDDGSGGLGSGEIIFGSDDIFFDPDFGKVVFGEVINIYSGDIRGRFEDGLIPEELLEYYIYYYDILYNVNNKENQE